MTHSAIKGTFPYPGRSIAEVDRDKRLCACGQSKDRKSMRCTMCAGRADQERSRIDVLTTPATTWCTQCDQQRAVAQIIACKSRFCPLDVKP